MISFETILFVILAVLTISSIRKTENSSLSLDKCLYLKGIFAVIVFINHVSTVEDILDPLYTYLALAVVAAFFFISGYGVMNGYIKENNYLNSFLKRRFFKLILPYLIITCVYWVYYLLIGEGISIKAVFINIINGTPIVTYSWFIIDIIYNYFVFYLLMLLSIKDKRIMNVSLVFLIMISMVLLLINSSFRFCINIYFGLGLLFAVYENKVSEFLQKNKYVIAPLSVAALFITQIINPLSLMGGLKIFIGNVLFILLMLIFVQSYTFENRFLYFFGTISLELYLLHGLAKMIIRRFINIAPFADDLFIFVLSILLSCIFHRLFILIKKWAK